MNLPRAFARRILSAATARAGVLAAVAFTHAACRRDMADQPRTKPLGVSQFFADGASSRPLPAHTIPRGQLHDDGHFFTGRVGGEWVKTFPEPVTRPQLDRGRERFEIHCAVCHGRSGEGRGMIVQRGFPAPRSLLDDRLRDAPVGYFFEVITRGYGLMFPCAARVEPADRWAIVAYIRALQLSGHATLADAEPAARAKLEASAP